MKKQLSKEDIFSNLKMLVFEYDEKTDENLQALFKLAQLLNDIDTIKVLAIKYLLMDAILFLDNPAHNATAPDLIELITQNVGYEVVEDVVNRGTYINKKDNYGNTALIKASILNNVDIVKLLLQHDASVHDRLHDGSRLVEGVFALGHKEVLELLIEYGADDILDEYATRFFHDVNQKITSQFIAEQFVYEELDAARRGNDEAKHFVVKSGVNEALYDKAMRRSLPEVDGIDSPQQILVFQSLMPIMNENNRELIAKIRILTVEKIMSKYRIGKYEKKIAKLILDNASIIYIHNDHAMIDDERFELISKNKFYHRTRKLYLEMLNEAVVFSKLSYDNNGDKEYFAVVKQENILKYDVVHNPKRLVEILNLFTDDNPIKYTAHSFDWNKYGSYEDFIKEVKNTFETIDDELKFLSQNLHKKISKFLFSDQLSESNTWGINRIGFGWSSKELRDWSQLEELKADGKKAIYFTLPKEHIKVINGKTIRTFDDVCNIFKNEIEIRDDDILSLLFQKIEEDILGYEFEVEYNNLEGISFYTDVENLTIGLIHVFEQFKNSGREQYDCIKVEAKMDDDFTYVEIKIVQIGSYVSKLSSEMKFEIQNGGFKDIKKCFTSLCDWSIETRCKDGNYRIDYLSINNTEPLVNPIEYLPEGFTYILRFYK